MCPHEAALGSLGLWIQGMTQRFLARGVGADIYASHYVATCWQQAGDQEGRGEPTQSTDGMKQVAWPSGECHSRPNTHALVPPSTVMDIHRRTKHTILGIIRMEIRMIICTYVDEHASPIFPRLMKEVTLFLLNKHLVSLIVRRIAL